MYEGNSQEAELPNKIEYALCKNPPDNWKLGRRLLWQGTPLTEVYRVLNWTDDQSLERVCRKSFY